MTAFSSSSLLRWRTLLFTPRCSPSKTASWRPPWKPNALISGTASGNRSMSCTPTSKCKAEEVPQIFQSNRADLGPVIEKSWFKTRGLRESLFYMHFRIRLYTLDQLCYSKLYHLTSALKIPPQENIPTFWHHHFCLWLWEREEKSTSKNNRMLLLRTK